jgi:endonuclease/exonuclease/phosphatase family metal-dependent hydrolase
MKLVSLNIEGNKHLERVEPFLKKEGADVACIQEVFEKDAQTLAKNLGLSFVFAPMYLDSYSPQAESLERKGIAIFTRFPLHNTAIHTYWSPGTELKRFDMTGVDAKRQTERGILLRGDLISKEGVFTLATTHFTWTPDGMPNEYQEADSDALLGILSGMPDVILGGDFNIPRGVNSVYKKFAARYTDAIPASYISSLDTNLHRIRGDAMQKARLEKFMVDYIFLSEKYTAENVRLESGVSDHMAVVGDILIKEA